MAIKRKSIFTGALILTAAGVITRILGFVYRIYMTNAIGAEGIGLYQLIMPIYSLCWSISCAGLTTTVSKLTASENAKREYGNMGRILKQSRLFTIAVSLVVSAVLFLFSSRIAVVFLKEERTRLSLSLLAAAVPFMAAGSCIRGYFFGLQKQLVPAISQVLEQLTRMAAIALLASAFIPRGLEYACLAAVAGVFLGELISFIYVLAAYIRFKRKNKLIKKPVMPAGQTMAMIISMALPLSLNRISGSLLLTLENLLIPQRLQMYGMSAKEAISLFGQITGMAMPLIFFPSAILVSLSIALVPAIAEASAMRNVASACDTITKSLIFTSVIGSFAAMIFMTAPGEIGRLIYNQDIGHIIFMLGFICPLWYLNITLNGILNGLGHQLFIFKCSVFSSFLNIGAIFFFVPVFGANAFICGWFLSLAAVTLISFIKIRSTLTIKINAPRWIGKPNIAAAACGLTVKYLLRHGLPRLFGEKGAAVAALALMAAGYAIAVVLLGCIKLSDIKKLLHRI
jgi:stage V sporulation protein B